MWRNVCAYFPARMEVLLGTLVLIWTGLLSVPGHLPFIPTNLQASDYLIFNLISLSRFLSSYDSRFSIAEDLNRIQQCTASVDDTRVDYILTAVDSARKAFPCRLVQRKNDDQQGSDLNVKLSGSDVGNHVNGRLDEWREENIPDVNGFVEDKVK